MKTLRGLLAGLLMLALAPAIPAYATQTTFVTPISPLTMANLKAFLDSALGTVATNYSGAIAPATGPGNTTYLYQLWMNTNAIPVVLSIYDGTNWVSIGTLTPSAHSWTYLTKGTFALVNGLNSNISNGSASFLRVTGPTAAFSIGGFTTGTVAAYRITIYNSTAQAMTIVNEDTSSTAGNRIKTLTGGNVVLRAGTSAATFTYDEVDARWILTSSN